MEGFGRLYFPYGGHHEGYFKGNKADGLGILRLKNQTIYAGNWNEGKLSGICSKYIP